MTLTKDFRKTAPYFSKTKMRKCENTKIQNSPNTLLLVAEDKIPHRDGHAALVGDGGVVLHHIAAQESRLALRIELCLHLEKSTAQRRRRRRFGRFTPLTHKLGGALGNQTKPLTCLQLVRGAARRTLGVALDSIDGTRLEVAAEIESALFVGSAMHGAQKPVGIDFCHNGMNFSLQSYNFSGTDASFPPHFFN